MPSCGFDVCCRPGPVGRKDDPEGNIDFRTEWIQHGPAIYRLLCYACRRRAETVPPYRVRAAFRRSLSNMATDGTRYMRPILCALLGAVAISTPLAGQDRFETLSRPFVYDRTAPLDLKQQDST